MHVFRTFIFIVRNKIFLVSNINLALLTTQRIPKASACDIFLVHSAIIWMPFLCPIYGLGLVYSMVNFDDDNFVKQLDRVSATFFVPATIIGMICLWFPGTFIVLFRAYCGSSFFSPNIVRFINEKREQKKNPVIELLRCSS